MQEACGHLVEVQDFRILCKKDVGNGVLNFVRSIYEYTIHACFVQYLAILLLFFSIISFICCYVKIFITFLQ